MVGKLEARCQGLFSARSSPGLFPDQTTAGAGDGVAETAAVGGAFVVSPMFLARPKPSVRNLSPLPQPFTGVQTGTDPT